MAAWKQLGRRLGGCGRTSRCSGSLLPISRPWSNLEPTAEIANLLYRRNASPALAAVTALPISRSAVATRAGCGECVAAEPDIFERILAHAESGTTLIIATPPSPGGARPAEAGPSEHDREYHALGKGQMVAYSARSQIRVILPST